jgi:hypothetical protein
MASSIGPLFDPDFREEHNRRATPTPREGRLQSLQNQVRVLSALPAFQTTAFVGFHGRQATIAQDPMWGFGWNRRRVIQAVC